MKFIVGDHYTISIYTFIDFVRDFVLLKSIHAVSQRAVGGLHHRFPDATCDSLNGPCALYHGNHAYAVAEKPRSLRQAHSMKFFGDDRNFKRDALSSAGPIQAIADRWSGYQIIFFSDGWLGRVWLAVTEGCYIIQAMYNRSVSIDLWC